MCHRQNATRNRQLGMTMLEVLIAILILSVGLFAMLGLVMNGMKLTSTSNFRAMASQYAYSMTDFMNTNAPIVFAYDKPDAAVEAECFGDGTKCKRSDILGTQIQLWQDQVAAALPSGAGTVCRSSSATGTPGAWACSAAGSKDPFVVKICWDESRIGVTKDKAAVGTPYYECIYTHQ